MAFEADMLKGFLPFALLQVLKFILAFVDKFVCLVSGYSILYGSTSCSRVTAFEDCVHRSRIIGRSRGHMWKDLELDNFMIIHDSYCHPDIIKDDKVSLVGFGKDHVLFVETKSNVDIFSSKVAPFVKLVRYQFTLVSQPLSILNC